MAVANAVLRSQASDAATKTPLPIVRETVRDLLLSSAAYHSLDPEARKDTAQALVSVCHTAVSLLQEEARSSSLVGERPAVQAEALTVQPSPRPITMAQNAGQQFSGVSAERVAGTTRAILNAVSFPRFVTELINGVFKALVDSNQQQMQSYVDLIKNVAATLDGFSDMNLGPDQARQWVVDTFPGSFVIEGGADEDTDPEDRAEENASARIKQRDGASM